MSGGGSTPRPGEISLAHNGVLFLDELPEFRRDSLEVLRQPLEDGVVQISRVAGTMRYPARFQLVCAMNPCKCGWYGHPSGKCTCSEQSIRQYLSRLSGPLLDRIDIQVEVPALNFDELRQTEPSEPSCAIRARWPRRGRARRPGAWTATPTWPGPGPGVLRAGQRRGGADENGLQRHEPLRPQL